MRALRMAAAVAAVLSGPAGAQVEEFDFGSEVLWGGRSVAVTIHPLVSSTAIEAAEGGGLYRTSDGGVTWSRIDSFPMFRMEDVLYNPNNGDLVIATTIDDGRDSPESGVWRSGDGGATWSRAAVPFGCTTRPDAWGIAMPKGVDVAGLVFVATDCGVAFSDDGGATWASADPTGGTGMIFYDVAATRTGPGQVRTYACGPAGVYTATAAGGSAPVWTPANTAFPFTGGGRCRITTSPFRDDVVFLTKYSCPIPPAGCGTDNELAGHRVFESDDGGVTWTDLEGPRARNRPPWVETQRTVGGGPNDFDLYWGNGVTTHRQRCTNDNNPATVDCPVAADPNCADAVDNDGDGVVNEGCPQVGAVAEDSGWAASQCKDAADDDFDLAVNDGCPVMERFDALTHGDPSGMAFDPVSGCPALISNDGGIGRSTNCGLSWTDSNRGRRALQIYNDYGTVRGPGPTELDLYFGTQDNAHWYTLDGGLTWTNPGCCEGWQGYVDRRVPPGGLGDIRMTLVNAAPPVNTTATRGFGGWSIWPFGFWPNPPGTSDSAGPVQFGNQRWAQISHDYGTPPDYRLYIMQPETGAQCGNGLDDDADGAVNDGCPANGAAESGTQCHDAADSDGDGVINDGCSHIWSPESGAECANAADDDGDGVANDECPSAGPAPETKAQCLNALDDDGDTLVNDGCPTVGVWGPMGPVISQTVGHPLLVSGPAAAPTFYLSVDVGFNQFQLRRISGPMDASATIAPASGVGPERLRNIAFYCGAWGTWWCPRVVAVDPSDPQRLYAADTATNQMKFTTNGGGTWNVAPELTELVTAHGEFRFDGFQFSEPWSIAWDPEDSQTILVGTEQAGLVATVDGGAGWFTVPGSVNRIPFVTSFFFDQDHDVIWAATYGRGLWTVRLPEQADLELVAKTDSPDPITAGRTLTYQIQVTNHGPGVAPNVKVTDVLPAGVSYTSDTDSCAEGPPGSLTCSLGNLSFGASRTFSVRVEVDPGLVLPPDLDTTITNTASVASPIPDPVPGNNQATADTLVKARLDHFNCYKSRQRPATRIATLQLDDQFGPGTVKVRGVRRLCAPANKQGQDPDAASAPEHLVGFKSRQHTPRFKRLRDQVVENQFGTLTLDVGRPKTVLVPTSKGLAATPPPLADPLVDHFKCHKVKKGRFRLDGVAVVDQFGPYTVDIKRAKRLCSPADKVGSGVVEPIAHLLCYRARSVPRRPELTTPPFVHNQLTDRALSKVRRLKWFCVPSVMKP